MSTRRSTPGPSGRPLSPPPWLRNASFEISIYPPGTRWLRCHRTAFDAIFFGPGAGNRPKYRFDAPDGEYQVLYLGLDYEAAFIETLLRNPRRRVVDTLDLAERSMTILTNDHPLRLVRAHGRGLSRLGTTAALSSGPYRESRLWSVALWRHPSAPDGLVYGSRHNPEHLCAAVFDRSHVVFSLAASAPLLDDPRRVRDVLASHGKSVA